MISLRQNVEGFKIEMNCLNESPDLKFFVKESEESRTLTIFRLISYSNTEAFPLPVILTKQTYKWKQRLESFYLYRFPYFIFFISLVEIIFYYAADDKLKRLLIYDTENKDEIWRFITYMLLHTDPIHLGLNVIIQALLGIPLEYEQGCFQCAAVYFGGGLAGSFGAFVFPPFSLMAGASGGVYALLLSHIPNTVLNYGALKYAGYRIATVLALAFGDIVHVSYHIYFYNNESPQIGWVAHASGALAGFLLGFLVFKGNSKWKRKFQTISCILFLVVCVLGVIRIIYFDYSLALVP